MRKIKKAFLSFILIAACLITPLGMMDVQAATKGQSAKTELSSGELSLDDIPEYSGSAYVTVNNNVPFFKDSEMTTKAFEKYSSLDSKGRCGTAYANVCTDIMPTEERGKIGSVKPSGWHTVKYDIVSGKYLYNRCHLIGYQLSAENANEKNLITGTRYLNIEGMLPFEDMVADYVKETNNHVLYRVTPIFEGDNLLASGVLMEAKSVEDDGAGIEFNVYCYNVQPGITIDYSNGDSALEGSSTSTTNTSSSSESKSAAYAVATAGLATASSGMSSSSSSSSSSSKAKASKSSSTSSTSTSNSDSDESTIVHITKTGTKYHKAGCRTLKSDIEVTLKEAKAQGLSPCKVCNPPQ
jgi:DNA-entry nuclease